jgi:hypothetical protein
MRCCWLAHGRGGERVPPAATCDTAHVTHHISHITRHTSHITRHTTHITRHTTHITCHTSHITHHTMHIPRLTSHVTRHTSHITRVHSCQRLSLPSCNGIQACTPPPLPSTHKLRCRLTSTAATSAFSCFCRCWLTCWLACFSTTATKDGGAGKAGNRDLGGALAGLSRVCHRDAHSQGASRILPTVGRRSGD